MAKRLKPRASAAINITEDLLPVDRPEDDLTSLEATEQRVDTDLKGRFDRRGARSKYNAELFPRQARLLVARGATQDEVADCFGVSKRTLQYWLNEYPKLSEAFQTGRDVFLPRVERALAERALGFWVEWEQFEAGIMRKKRQYFPPDTTAAIFFLKNTAPGSWRDVAKIEHSGAFTSAESLAEKLGKQLQALMDEGLIDVTPVRALTDESGQGSN